MNANKWESRLLQRELDFLKKWDGKSFELELVDTFCNESYNPSIAAYKHSTHSIIV